MTSGFREAQTTVLSPRNVTIFIPYNTVDTYQTTFAPGCFSRSLAAQMPPVLWSHKQDQVIGKVVGFRDAPEGLTLDIRLANPDAVPAARMASSLLADGMVPGISFGFRDGVGRPDPNHRDATQFVSAHMREVSFVADPAIPGTKVLALRETRTTTDDDYQSAMRILDRIRDDRSRRYV